MSATDAASRDPIKTSTLIRTTRSRTIGGIGYACIAEILGKQTLEGSKYAEAVVTIVPATFARLRN